VALANATERCLRTTRSARDVWKGGIGAKKGLGGYSLTELFGKERPKKNMFWEGVVLATDSRGSNGWEGTVYEKYWGHIGSLV